MLALGLLLLLDASHFLRSHTLHILYAKNRAPEIYFEHGDATRLLSILLCRKLQGLS